LSQRTSVGIQNVTGRQPPRRFPGDDEAFARLFDNLDTRDSPDDRTCAVGAGIVDDDDLVWGSGLGKKRIETGRQQVGFVIGANDRGDRHAPRSLCR
jgi:hypothetical protein